MPHNSRFAVSCAKGAALSADEIYRRSFALIDKETNFGAMEKEMRKIAARMIHACAMPDIIADLHWSRTAIAAGKTALRAGKPIFLRLLRWSQAGSTGKIYRPIIASMS